MKVAVFTEGDRVALAKEAGADVVGLEDLAERVRSGDFDFDVGYCFTGCDAYAWKAWPNTWPERINAESENRHGDRRYICCG